MATRSTIAYVRADGTVSQIYCHWDGYLENNGAILKEHYDTPEKVEALVALGDLSSLAESPECPEGHTFETPVKGYCVAYGRDRGEEGTEVQNFDSVEEFKNEGREEEFNYVFDAEIGGWVYDNGTF